MKPELKIIQGDCIEIMLGIEIDPDNFREAEERIQNETRQTRLDFE